jgi:hypothetical protein
MKNALIVLVIAAFALSAWFAFSSFQDREPVDYEVIVETPQTGDTVTSPLTIVGRAHTNWYSEGTFPVEVRNSMGEIIGQGMAEKQEGASADNGYIPFSALVTFTANPGEQGSLVFKRSNPGGKNEYDLRTEVSVIF